VRHHRAASLLEKSAPILADRDHSSMDDLDRVHEQLAAMKKKFNRIHARIQDEELTPAKSSSFAQVDKFYRPMGVKLRDLRVGGEGRYSAADSDRPMGVQVPHDPLKDLDKMENMWKKEEAHIRTEEENEDNNDPPEAQVQADEIFTRAREQDRAEESHLQEEDRYNAVKSQELESSAEEVLRRLKNPEHSHPFREPPDAPDILSSFLQVPDDNALQHDLDRLKAAMRHAEDTIATPGAATHVARLTEAEVAAPRKGGDPLAAMLRDQALQRKATRDAGMEEESAKLLQSWAQPKMPSSSLLDVGRKKPKGYKQYVYTGDEVWKNDLYDGKQRLQDKGVKPSDVYGPGGDEHHHTDSLDEGWGKEADEQHDKYVADPENREGTAEQARVVADEKKLAKKLEGDTSISAGYWPKPVDVENMPEANAPIGDPEEEIRKTAELGRRMIARDEYNAKMAAEKTLEEDEKRSQNPIDPRLEESQMHPNYQSGETDLDFELNKELPKDMDALEWNIQHPPDLDAIAKRSTSTRHDRINPPNDMFNDMAGVSSARGMA